MVEQFELVEDLNFMNVKHGGRFVTKWLVRLLKSVISRNQLIKMVRNLSDMVTLWDFVRIRMRCHMIKYRYFSIESGGWHHTYTSFFKVKVDPNTGKDTGQPISISYEEYSNN